MSEPVLFGLPLHLLFLYFILYSFLGWCMETAYCSILERRFVPRGFLLGPVCPIYGVGVCMMICWFAPFMGSPLLFYVIATVCMSAWEYFVGWFLETTTHIKYWDYSMYKYNLHGRICLWVCLVWGVLAYLILYWIHPLVSHFVLMIPLFARRVAAVALAVLLLADAVTTIRKLALTARLMRYLDEARLQLALGSTELAERLQQARDDLTDRLAETREDLSDQLEKRAPQVLAAYEELLAKAERQSRRFRKRYSRLSSLRYEVDLSDVKALGEQLRQRLAQRRAQKKAGRKQQ